MTKLVNGVYVTNGPLTEEALLAGSQPNQVFGTDAQGKATWKDGSGSSDIFIAEYGVTTIEEVQDAISAGKLVFLKYTDGALIPCAGDFDSFVQFRGSVGDSMKLIKVTDTGWSMESDNSIQSPINKIVLG